MRDGTLVVSGMALRRTERSSLAECALGETSRCRLTRHGNTRSVASGDVVRSWSGGKREAPSSIPSRGNEEAK